MSSSQNGQPPQSTCNFNNHITTPTHIYVVEVKRRLPNGQTRTDRPSAYMAKEQADAKAETIVADHRGRSAVVEEQRYSSYGDRQLCLQTTYSGGVKEWVTVLKVAFVEPPRVTIVESPERMSSAESSEAG